MRLTFILWTLIIVLIASFTTPLLSLFTSLNLRHDKNKHVKIALEGPFLGPEGVATVNRQLLNYLKNERTIDVTALPRAGGVHKMKFNPPGQVDILIRNFWPPDFTRDYATHLVLAFPWEFGVVPYKWVHSIAENVTEVWVPSKEVKRQLIASGVPIEKVMVIGHGVAEDFFNSPQNSFTFSLRCHAKTFKLLYRGALLARKGIDILLGAYQSEFNNSDDVCLVIQASYGDGFFLDEISKAINGDGPVVELISHHLSHDEVLDLGHSCHSLVHPYRGEGYGLPILEAMAMGLPVIVTSGGPSDDFVQPDFAFILPSVATECWLPPCEFLSVFGMATIEQPWWREVNPVELRKAMRHVYSHRDEENLMGSRARDAARKMSWKHVFSIIADRILQLKK